jgi:hypothetical protein
MVVYYGILGIVWLMCVEKYIQQHENKLQRVFIRLGNFLLWPISLITFMYYFIVELFNLNNIK